ncbi:hypothetical protein ACFOLF_10410 [Paenibacillus sepulcri]|uniref:Coat protein n=1 Tax=Paenibacillus sepulcri TaxID=359917 RepID=A0ABS7C8Y0_9BACL|nr:hypothetical protein [Paenibacillus sepulcri]
MAAVYVKPKMKRPGKGKIVRLAKPKGLAQATGPIFNRLTVVWVQGSGVPFNTTGFFARLIRNNRIVSTAAFDRFGVVRFNNINTLTNVSYTLQVFSPIGLLFRVRTIPARVETFAVIG